MAKAARDALRPYVYLDFTFRGGGTLMFLTVGNSGSKGAADVKIKLVKSTSDELTRVFAPLPIANEIGHISPGSTRRYSLAVPINHLWPENAPSPVLEFDVSYRDGRHKIAEMQQVDFGGYRLSSPERDDPLGETS